MGEKGVEALAKLSNLTELNLENNNIGNEGAKALANGNFERLIKLNLENNNIDNEGVEALIYGNFTHLTSLHLSHEGVYKYFTAAIFVLLEERRMKERLKEESQNKIREMEEKLNEESQNRLREMEERHQTELARVREENQDGLKKVTKIFMKLIQNVANDAQKARASQQQAQAAANDQTTCPDSQLGEVQPISRDQSLDSSRSSGSK